MIPALTFGVAIAVAYASLREGFLTAISMLVNVLIAGMVTFNFYEPLANELESIFSGTFLAGYEDAVVMVLLFCVTLGGLRVLANNLAPNETEFPALLQQIGAALVSLGTGYLVAGFLFCVFQTLPWGEKFLGFEHVVESGAGGTRRLVPPDRVWLGMMHRAGAVPFSQEGRDSFDADGSFELRYARLRRFKEQP